MSMWKTAMTWLGLGPDAEYEQGPDAQGRAFADPALQGEQPVATAASPPMTPMGGVGGPVGPMAERGPNDFSAVRSLGPMSDDEGLSDVSSHTGVSGLSNQSLRPIEVDNRNDPPMGSVQAVPAVPASKPQIVAPRSFNDAQEVADRFRGGAPVVLNLKETAPELGRRLIDFCSGLCYGLRGQMQRVGDGVFLVIPADVQLSAEDHRLLRDSGLLN
jgi:cell division inhibitor SepF